jgi:hypothetical protein
MAAPTPPAAPTTTATTTTAPSIASGVAGFGGGLVTGLVFGLPAVLLIALLLVALRARAGRKQPGRVQLVVLRPDGPASVVQLSSVVGPVRVMMEEGKQIVFLPDPKDAIRLANGNTIYIGVAVPIAATTGANMLAGTSINPFLAFDSDGLAKIAAAKGVASTMEVRAGGLMEVIDKLLAEGTTKVEGAERSPALGVEIVRSVDVQALAAALASASAKTVSSLAEASLIMFNTGTTINKLMQSLIRLGEVRFSGWARLALIGIVAFIIIVVLLTSLHI